jgi:hypothetical protein
MLSFTFLHKGKLLKITNCFRDKIGEEILLENIFPTKESLSKD